ncbi:MAG: glycosyltransferase [Bacteroidales bacterium]|jgi:glycosyltransferase involved in cell wall biosynthesis|nr:glycosyltransferase [Bacteroidales bacterium]
MEHNPKVSVIIPVYNSADYLKETLLSVINQTLRDIEIIVINDGSTDKSEEIIEFYQKGDSRIKYWFQPNQGQSIARNAGLDNARGDFVYFMDSDDLLEQDALGICYNKCISEDLDFVFFDADVFSASNAQIGWEYIRAGKITEEMASGEVAMEKLLNTNLFRVAPWLFFIKRAFIENFKLRFYPGIIHEDELFTTQMFLLAQRVEYISKVFFHRRVRQNSTMTTRFSAKNVEGYLTVIRELRLFADRIDNHKKIIVEREIYLITNSLVYQSHILSVKERRLIIQELKKLKCLGHADFKSLIVMSFPFTVKIKPKLKKFLLNFKNIMHLNWRNKS